MPLAPSRRGGTEDARVLGLAKLGNVALAMLWGFAVTYVFVRLLPIEEFRAFLLLVAFANFTISADFGFSGILYARLRRHWLTDEGSDFQPRELGALAAFMALVLVAGGLAIGAALAAGLIPTRLPGLFLAFYLLSALNLLTLLAKRALAAVDRNLFWEIIDAVRRLSSLGLLFAALAGVPILLSTLLQIVATLVALAMALWGLQGALGTRARTWVASPAMMIATGRAQARDMGATMALTLSDVAAYNAPYFALALATRDPRPILVFDFVFKISRALSAIIRALVEAGLPRLTAAVHGDRQAEAGARLRHLVMLSTGCAVLLGGTLLAVGPALSGLLFDGHAVLDQVELAILAVLLLGLSLLCVSTYVHNALGRFVRLLPPSFAFLAGSVLSVPLAMALGLPLAPAFLGLYALVHGLVALRHAFMLRGLIAR